MTVAVFANTCQILVRSGQRITVTAGAARDDVNGSTLTLAANTDILIDATVGAAAGLDTGVLAASTWYSVYLIYGASPGTSVIMSASQANPTLPGSYTTYAWVGFVYVGAASTFTIGQNLEDAVAPAGALARSMGKLWTRLAADAAAAGALTADTIAEETAATGVTIDGLRLMDATIKPAAGGSAFVDLTAVATGEADVVLKDNLALALEVREATNSYLAFVTTDAAESVAVGKRLTTTDGVASGTVKVVGGQASAAILATDNLLASAGASAHVDHAQTYSIPASTIKSGSHCKIRAMVRVTNADGTDTLECKLYIGATTLITTTAVDPDAVGDFVLMEFDLWSRAAPGAAVSLTGYGGWVSSDGGVLARGDVILTPTNHATNGALIVKVSSKWSATTALTNARLEILDVEIL